MEPAPGAPFRYEVERQERQRSKYKDYGGVRSPGEPDEDLENDDGDHDTQTDETAEQKSVGQRPRPSLGRPHARDWLEPWACRRRRRHHVAQLAAQ